MPASFLDPYHVACTTPAADSTGVVAVRLSSNDVDFTEPNGGAEFTFVETRLSVVDMAPKNGPVAGGTQVAFTGTGFVPGTHCRFGDELTEAFYLGPEKVICTAPAATSAGISLERDSCPYSLPTKTDRPQL